MMNNEPVALTQIEIMNALTLGIPLYTNPHSEDSVKVKELTDRIAELEKIVKNTIAQAFYEDDFHKAEATIARQMQTVDRFAEENAKLCNRIAELEKQELNDGGEPVKNATYWKRQYNLMASQNENLKSGLYHANEQIKYLESHPVKEQLTDEEIYEIGKQYLTQYEDGLNDFARAILRKAQDK